MAARFDDLTEQICICYVHIINDELIITRYAYVINNEMVNTSNDRPGRTFNFQFTRFLSLRATVDFNAL